MAMPSAHVACCAAASSPDSRCSSGRGECQEGPQRRPRAGGQLAAQRWHARGEVREVASLAALGEAAAGAEAEPGEHERAEAVGRRCAEVGHDDARHAEQHRRLASAVGEAARGPSEQRQRDCWGGEDDAVQRRREADGLAVQSDGRDDSADADKQHELREQQQRERLGDGGAWQLQNARPPCRRGLRSALPRRKGGSGRGRRQADGIESSRWGGESEDGKGPHGAHLCSRDDTALARGRKGESENYAPLHVRTLRAYWEKRERVCVWLLRTFP